MGPTLTSGLLISFAWGIIVAIIMYSYFHLYGWSAITMGIIVAFIIINVTYPFGTILFNDKDIYSAILYVFIETIIPIYLFIVLIVMLLRFTKDPNGETVCSLYDLEI